MAVVKRDPLRNDLNFGYRVTNNSRPELIQYFGTSCDTGAEIPIDWVCDKDSCGVAYMAMTMNWSRCMTVCDNVTILKTTAKC